MEITNANEKVKLYENEITKLLDRKEEYLSKVLPQSTDTTKERVSSSRLDRNSFLINIIYNEDIDSKIDFYYNLISIYNEFIEKELIRLNKYKEVNDLIIYYRDSKHMKWDDIAKTVRYSTVFCKKCYKKSYTKRTSIY